MAMLLWKVVRPAEAGVWRMRKRGATEFNLVRIHATTDGLLVTSLDEHPPALWLDHPAYHSYEWNGPVEIPPPGEKTGQRWFCRAAGTWFEWSGAGWIPSNG